jgi:ribonuclease P protein component
VTWLLTPLTPSYPAQVLIAVNKQTSRRAVDRNKIKRLIREAYRTNKSILYEPLKEMKKQCALSLVYIGNQMISYNEMESIIIVILHRLISEYDRTAG